MHSANTASRRKFYKFNGANIKMKQRLHIGIYIISPLILSAICTHLLFAPSPLFTGRIASILLFACYTLPLFGFYYFIKRRPFNQWLLLVGFLLCPIMPLIYETAHPAMSFQYLGTWLFILFYALPFLVISFVIALILTIKGKKRTPPKQTPPFKDANRLLR